MTGSDDEFENFLKRRKPTFRAPDDLFEPPAELDRIVLRQAREAIEDARPMRVFRGLRWAAPIAIAATLVLGLAVVFHAGLPPKRDVVPEVTVQNVAQRVEYQPAAPVPVQAPPAAPPAEIHGPIVVDLAAPTQIPAWRRDAKTWLAEIERLRSAGNSAGAEAELAEFKRQQRAYAGAPDR
jgi:hypothetical protein